jgi:hypothetical protein
MDISLISNSALRIAIRRNLVSFPAQIPALMKRPAGDAQERMAQLYFSLGWTVRSLCDRYCLSKAMVQKLLSEWRVRAVGAGYIQDIHPDELEFLLALKDENDSADSVRDMPAPVGVAVLSGARPEMASTASVSASWR